MIESFFASDCTPEDRAWIWSKVTSQPLRPYEERVDLERFYRLELPKTDVRCTRSMGRVPREAAERLGMSYVEIDAGHDAMVSRPEEVARIFLGKAVPAR